MPVSNGKVMPPINLEEIRALLGEEKADNYSVCRSRNVNMWAKYRPIPVPVNNALNKRTPLTTKERVCLSWGFTTVYEKFSNIWDFPVSCCNILNNNGSFDSLAIKPLEWSEQKQWCRITDFACIEDKSLGYYHYAAPWYPIWKLKGEVTLHSMNPLLSQDERNVDIEEGLQMIIPIPDDKIYLDGLINNRENIVISDEDPLSVSAIDALMNILTVRDGGENNDLDPEYAGRGVLVLKYDMANSPSGIADTQWFPFGMRWDRKYETSANGSADSSIVGKSLDLSAGQSSDGFNYGVMAGVKDGVWNSEYYSRGGLGSAQRATWKDLEGRCAFVEFYSTGNDVMPIPGYAYDLTIIRQVAGYDNLDIEGVVMFAIAAGGNVYNDGFAFTVSFKNSVSSETWDNRVRELSDYYDELIVYMSSDKDGKTQASSYVDILSEQPADHGHTGSSGWAVYNMIYFPTADITGERLGYMTLRGRKKGSTAYAYKVSSGTWNY